MPHKDLDRRREYGREWIREHPDKAREAMRQWRERHPAEHAAANRLYYQRHKQELASYFAQYRREHREVRQGIHARRRARRLRAEGFHTTVEWIELLKTLNWTCAYCGERGALEPDHRIPLARGGSNSIENILPACPRCNRRKAFLTEKEFRARLRAEREEIEP
jgi:5-methylcytosine-specific restriction endonuclease McrA